MGTSKDATAITEWMTEWFSEVGGDYAIGLGAVDHARQGSWVDAAVPDAERAAQWCQDQLDRSPTASAYFRLTPIAAGSTGRGGAADTLCLPGFWLDVDIAGPGHNHNGDFRLPTEDEARELLALLPDPTQQAHSGGGFYSTWQFDTPITGASMADFSKRFGAASKAIFNDSGVHLDTVSDLPRVLKPAGTYNGKTSARLRCNVEIELGDKYDAHTLLDTVEALAPAAAPKTHRSPKPSVERPHGALSPAEACRELRWSTILESIGWEFVGNSRIDSAPVELWRRPGAHSDYSAKCFDDGPIVLHSDGSKLGEPGSYSKFDVLCRLANEDASGMARRIHEAKRSLRTEAVSA